MKCDVHLLHWGMHPINHPSACKSFGSHHIKVFPKTQVQLTSWFSCGAIRLVCLFHFHYPSGSQIIVCQPLKIQSNPRAMGKSAAELLFIRNQRSSSEFSGMFLLLKISILSFFPITLSSHLSLFLHSEVKDCFFFTQITQHYFSFPHTPLGAVESRVAACFFSHTLYLVCLCVSIGVYLITCVWTFPF